jgi:hypothetical protein
MQCNAMQCNATCPTHTYVCSATILTVTGASTLWTLLSSTRISLARRHSALTSPSRRYSHRLSRSICSSREELHIAPPPPPEAAPGCWADADVDVDGAPTDAVAAGVAGATAADAMVAFVQQVCALRYLLRSAWSSRSPVASSVLGAGAVWPERTMVKQAASKKGIDWSQAAAARDREPEPACL